MTERLSIILLGSLDSCGRDPAPIRPRLRHEKQRWRPQCVALAVQIIAPRRAQNTRMGVEICVSMISVQLFVRRGGDTEGSNKN